MKLMLEIIGGQAWIEAEGVAGFWGMISPAGAFSLKGVADAKAVKT